jgi:hypothetical protein
MLSWLMYDTLNDPYNAKCASKAIDKSSLIIYNFQFTIKFFLLMLGRAHINQSREGLWC